MILRAAIVVLLVLNLGVAAWWVAAGDQAARDDTRVTLGAPGLRLVSERVPPAVAAPAAAAPAATPVVPPVQAAVQSANITQCLRFGPFADSASRDAARAALTASGVASLPRETAARSGRGWKVYIPAFASRDEAKAMGERIKAAGISDWYVMNEGSDANSIALGRYGGEDAARRREAELRGKGIPAQAEALGTVAPQWWLDARLPPGTEPAALAGAGPSRSVDCAGRG